VTFREAAVAELDIEGVEERAEGAVLALGDVPASRKEIRLARALQESMISAVRPALHGVDVSYRYLPASDGVRIGGDWFDALPLPGGRTALAVGDVMGHGWRSAAVMGQLRAAIHALCTLDLAPAELLRRLDRLAQQLGDGHLATCLFAVYDPVARRCRMASAGHIPPVLVHPRGRPEVLQPPTGPPVGVGGGFETAEFSVPDGSHLILCTDGLVTPPGRDVAAGMRALCERVAGRARPLEQICEDAVRPLTGVTRTDDAALLVARLRGPGGDVVVETSLAPAPGVIPQARAFTRAALTRWRMEGAAPAVELLVSELVTNAVRHATRPIRLRLVRTSGLLCEVSDGDTAMPRIREPDESAESGRGLQLVAALSLRWGACRAPGGKVVWFEHPGTPEG